MYQLEAILGIHILGAIFVCQKRILLKISRMGRFFILVLGNIHY